MQGLLMRSIVISLFIILFGIIAIFQINYNFTTNVTIKTGVTDAVKNMNSIGALIAATVMACLLFLILSSPKKKIAGKAKKAKKAKTKRSKKRQR